MASATTSDHLSRAPLEPQVALPLGHVHRRALKQGGWPPWDTTPPAAPRHLISVKDHPWSQNPVACGAGACLQLLPGPVITKLQGFLLGTLAEAPALRFHGHCPGLPPSVPWHISPGYSGPGCHPPKPLSTQKPINQALLLPYGKPLGISLLPSSMKSQPFISCPRRSPRDSVSFRGPAPHLLTKQPYLGCDATRRPVHGSGKLRGF